MILTAKLSGMAYAYSDGGKKEAELTPDQRDRQVKVFPSVMNVLSFTFFGPGSLCGPFYEFRDHIDLMDRQGVYSNVPSSIVPTLIATLRAFGKQPFLTSLVTMAFYIAVSLNFYPLMVTTDEFGQKNFFVQVLSSTYSHSSSNT